MTAWAILRSSFVCVCARACWVGLCVGYTPRTGAPRCHAYPSTANTATPPSLPPPLPPRYTNIENAFGGSRFPIVQTLKGTFQVCLIGALPFTSQLPCGVFMYVFLIAIVCMLPFYVTRETPVWLARLENITLNISVCFSGCKARECVFNNPTCLSPSLLAQVLDH